MKFCKKHKIDFVFPHLQYLNLVAAFSQRFLKATVFPMRHHSDDVYLSGNRNARRLDRLVNTFSKKILVVSERCREQMVQHENVAVKKIIVMPLYYNLDYYQCAAGNNSNLSVANNRTLNLVSIGRMVENKNHITLLKAVKKLVDDGLHIKLVLLDTGPLETELKKFVIESELDDHVCFLGRQSDVIKYIRAADMLVHPSISEGSSQVVKEAGICNKPVMVVKGVGDFDEYITHEKSGFLLSRADMEPELTEILRDIYDNRLQLPKMGKELNKAVREKFELTPGTFTYASIIAGTIC
jgi:glycosyltransferase involved in cell wall biosynthesis